MAVPLSSTIIGCSNVIVQGSRYLLVQESKVAARARYNLPAGKPELGETLMEAAAREALEETGLRVRPEYLIAIFHCPKTSEGVGVVNFVFSSQVLGGELTTTLEHPVVGYFTREEVAQLGRERRLRGVHIERAIDQFSAGARLAPTTVQLVPSSWPEEPKAPLAPETRDGPDAPV